MDETECDIGKTKPAQIGECRVFNGAICKSSQKNTCLQRERWRFENYEGCDDEKDDKGPSLWGTPREEAEKGNANVEDGEKEEILNKLWRGCRGEDWLRQQIT